MKRTNPEEHVTVSVRMSAAAMESQQQEIRQVVWFKDTEGVDAVIALQMAVRREHNDAADMDGNGWVTSVDALMVLQAAATTPESITLSGTDNKHQKGSIWVRAWLYLRWTLMGMILALRYFMWAKWD